MRAAVAHGRWVWRAPYGYRNVRKDGRGLVELDPEAADNVRRIFHLFAYEPLTLDALVDRLRVESRQFRASMPAGVRQTAIPA